MWFLVQNAVVNGKDLLTSIPVYFVGCFQKVICIWVERDIVRMNETDAVTTIRGKEVNESTEG